MSNKNDEEKSSRDLDEHTHRILLSLTAVMRFFLEAGEIHCMLKKCCDFFVMVMHGYSFKTTAINRTA